MKLFLQPNDIPALRDLMEILTATVLNQRLIQPNDASLRVLGTKLAYRTTATRRAGRLSTIYNDYVIYMTAFFAVYLSLSVDKVTNRGVFKLSAENATNTSDESKSIVEKTTIAISYEVNFKNL
jgi:hypothetical protein